MLKIIINTPIILFLYLSVALTQSSILFPQNIGQYQKVAGWPFAMYIVEYTRMADIKSSGEIIHYIVKSGSFLLWDKVFLNIIIWSIVMSLIWYGYQRLENNINSKS